MLLLRQGRVVCPSTGVDRVLDVRVLDGQIAEIGVDLAAGDARVVDCAGYALLPAFVDLVADLADPGTTWREDLRSGSLAAAAGGFATVLASPATDPVVDSGAIAQGLVDASHDLPGARVQRVGALTVGLLGQELTEMGSMLAAGCVAIGDGGRTVSDAAMLHNALSYARPFGGVVLLRPGQRALEARGCMHEGQTSVQLGLRGIPAAAEEIGIAMVIALVRATKARVHLTHVTTAVGAELLARAKDAGLSLTASVPARSLVLSDTAVSDSGYDSVTRLLPPLRPEQDRLAVCAAVVSGVIDSVCSDHTPWTRVEKELEFERAQPGAVGLETAFSATFTALDGDLPRVARALAVSPAAVLGRTARIVVGDVADLALVDPGFQGPCAPPVQSRSSNEPLVGHALRGRVLATVVSGRLIAAI
ncbi:MAG: dihydroorotase [Oligoflexia bacterium]|nr:dihydroorotase [Oligoflexia bacterium]